jgi:hypothetical protein
MSDQALAHPAETIPSENDTFIVAVLERMAAVLPPESGPYPLHEPHIDGAAWDYVKDCLDSGWVSSVGEYVRWFEDKLVETTGAGHAVATVTGTAALHVCMLLAGVERDDEVLVPPLTFVASANAIQYCGAHPHFVDIEPVSLGVDPDALQAHLERIAEMRGDVCYNSQTGRPIRALLVVHCFGHPARMAELAEVAARFNITLVEDAAEALGSTAGNRSAGCHGRLAALSFNGNKTITTGGGGAILTDDPLLAERAHHLTTTARVDDPMAMAHDMVAFNYRMPNLNAALGRSTRPMPRNARSCSPRSTGPVITAGRFLHPSTVFPCTRISPWRRCLWPKTLPPADLTCRRAPALSDPNPDYYGETARKPAEIRDGQPFVRILPKWWGLDYEHGAQNHRNCQSERPGCGISAPGRATAFIAQTMLDRARYIDPHADRAI